MGMQKVMKVSGWKEECRILLTPIEQRPIHLLREFPQETTVTAWLSEGKDLGCTLMGHRRVWRHIETGTDESANFLDGRIASNATISRSVSGRVRGVVAHWGSLIIGESSVHEKSVVNDRWSLTTRVAYGRFHCTWNIQDCTQNLYFRYLKPNLHPFWFIWWISGLILESCGMDFGVYLQNMHCTHFFARF